MLSSATVLAAAIAVALGAALQEGAAPQEAAAARDCFGSQRPLECVQEKALTFLERASKTRSISLGGWATLENDAPRQAKALTDQDIGLARSQGRLSEILWDRAADFLSSHTLKIDLPKVSSQELQRGLEEGRGKMKKMMSMMFMAGAMKMMAVVPMLLGVLALLAGKAFLISKMALVLSLLILLKKLIASKGDGHEVHHAVYAGGGHHGGGGWDRRSFDSSAHNLAYSAQKPL